MEFMIIGLVAVLCAATYLVYRLAARLQAVPANAIRPSTQARHRDGPY